MNIFYLDEDPHKAAKYHCDKHIVKMCLEYAQLLCTTHRVLGHDSDIFYRKTHVNHPCSVWARDTLGNYIFLFNLLRECLNEYEIRYQKVHKIRRSGLEEALRIAPDKIKCGNKTSPPLAMPENCVIAEQAVKSYRNYYILEKSRFAKWKLQTPEWFVYAKQN